MPWSIAISIIKLCAQNCLIWVDQNWQVFCLKSGIRVYSVVKNSLLTQTQFSIIMAVSMRLRATRRKLKKIPWEDGAHINLRKDRCAIVERYIYVCGNCGWKKKTYVFNWNIEEKKYMVISTRKHGPPSNITGNGSKIVFSWIEVNKNFPWLRTSSNIFEISQLCFKIISSSII